MTEKDFVKEGKPRYVDVTKPVVISQPRKGIRYVAVVKENMGRQVKFLEIRKEVFSKKNDKGWCPIYKSGWLLHFPMDRDLLKNFYSLDTKFNKMNKFLANYWKNSNHSIIYSGDKK